ncbi:MAG: SCP2 sterol-binding domain-containing protein [Streptosporangiaceae bacterium]
MPAAVQEAADPISQFFSTLEQPGRISTFEGESASLRFDVADGAGTERWRVQVTDGTVAVTRANAPADAVIKIRRPELEAIVSGRLNAQAAILRGLLTCEGSIAALIMFQRCLPGPPGSVGRAAPISSQAVTARRRSA